MEKLSLPSLFPITFHEDQMLLEYSPSQGRVDHSFDGGVTLSAVPNASGETMWEARSSDGKLLRTFGLYVETTKAGVLVTQPASGDGVCYYCYEDDIKRQSICIRTRCFVTQ